MKTIRASTVAGVALAAGVAVGGGGAAFEAMMRPWRVGDFSAATVRPDRAVPQAEVPETAYAFGTVGAGAEGEHVFTIKNTGAAPLVLSRGATSCSCTVSDFEPEPGEQAGAAAKPTHPMQKELPPGGETSVKVKWRGKGAGGPFRQQATILTNDPRRPEIAFVIEGTVVPTWKAIPDLLALPKVSADTGETITARVFTYGAAPPTVESLQASEEQTADFFTFTSAPLPPEELAAEAGATGGFLLTVTLKPGLPVGALRQAARMTLRIPEEITAELPIEGTVAGDISFAGRAWDSSRQRLLLGTVSSRVGLKSTLFLTARGPRRQEVKPTIREVVPESLQVAVGRGEPVGSGGVIRIPIDITIPPGSPPANHLGSEQAPAGRIVIDPGPDGAAPITIPVSLVIGP